MKCSVPKRFAMALKMGCGSSKVSGPLTSRARSGSTLRFTMGVMYVAVPQAESSNSMFAQPSSSGMWNFQDLSLTISSLVPSAYSMPIWAKNPPGPSTLRPLKPTTFLPCLSLPVISHSSLSNQLQW